MIGRTNAVVGEGGSSIPDAYGVLIENNTGEPLIISYMNPTSGKISIEVHSSSSAEITVMRESAILLESQKRGESALYLPDESYLTAISFYSEYSHIFYYAISADALYRGGGRVDVV